MIRLGRVTRRPDHWATPHDRARYRTAERLDGPLPATEAAWLEEHLADCEACLATAQAFEADRLALRSLRDIAPEPPRDLWARTSASIEQVAAGHRRASTGPARQSPLARWGAVAGIAVVVVVVGSAVLSGGWPGSPSGVATGPQDSVTAVLTPPPLPGMEIGPGATPIVVDAGAVGWFDVGADGSYAYNVANVDQVCAKVDQASCAALDDGEGRRVALATSPKSIISSPSNSQAVVVGVDGSEGNQVFVVVLPGDPDASPSPSPTPAAATPTPTPSPAAPTPPPAAATPTPTLSSAASTAPTGPTPCVAIAQPDARRRPADSDAQPGCADADGQLRGVHRSDKPAAATPTPTLETTPVPSATPAPTAAALEIVSGVAVVGDAAAFSPDGAWFAFTARPADGSAGPDIYVWRVGDPQARAMTTDHRSTFGSWADGLVIGSRPGPPPTLPAPPPGDTDTASPAADVDPITFTIDPTTGAEAILPVAWWRPSVSPTGERAVVWDGSVVVDGGNRIVTSADGQLVLVPWAVDDAGSIDLATPIVSEGPIADFTVRWDDTGSWLAVWLADAGDPTVGRLSLLHIDPTSGAIDRPDAGPQDVPALPGFSIGSGRLAWATPRSQDGEASHVHIVAWSADGVGSIESAPGQDVVIVR